MTKKIDPKDNKKDLADAFQDSLNNMIKNVLAKREELKANFVETWLANLGLNETQITELLSTMRLEESWSSRGVSWKVKFRKPKKAKNGKKA